MKKRIIGGTIFSIMVYLTLIFNYFIFMLLFFMIFGLIELIKIYPKIKNKRYYFFYFTLFFLGIIAMNYVDMQSNGNIYLLIFVSLIMLADVFAYFVGKKLGKNKFSEVSPNKTIEGLVGGVVGSLLIFLFYLYVLDKPYHLTFFSDLNILMVLIIIITILLTSILGDLLESKLKRLANIKDSGTIIYGHGGVLDRIDSWIAGSLIYSIVIMLYS